MRTAIVLAACTLLFGGCGGSSDSATTEGTTEPTETTETTAVADALDCLDAAGLSDVEERSAGPWRGFHDAPFYGVTVERFASQAEARRVARDAVDVYAAQAVEFVVIGPFKPSAGGLVNEEEAREANDLVQQIAACLGR